MNIIQALELCQQGQRVRPVCWRESNPCCCVEYRQHGEDIGFVECDAMGEMEYCLDLHLVAEFLGEWEVCP